MFFRKSFVQQIILSSIIFLKISTAYAQVGKVGINTTTPAAMLHVKDGSVVFTGFTPLPVIPGNPPVSDAGVRMMWYPDKAAFRAGLVNSTQWNRDSIGNHSVAMGSNTKAKGNSSIALGYSSHAIGDYSIALGSETIANGYRSTAMGYLNLASGWGSTAMGSGTTAIGEVSISAGLLTKAEGDYSTAMGTFTKSKSYNSFVLGRYNDTTSISSTGWNSNDPLFIVGNGTANNARSNALTVLKNGNIGIGSTTPGFPITFPNTIGDKISLYGQSGNHFGFGVNGNTMQIHAAESGDAIAFGYGSSFTIIERMRIKGNGFVGIGTLVPNYILDINGRMRIRSGGSNGTSPGIWLNAIDNSGLATFIGMADDSHLGIYSQLDDAWNFFINLNNGNVGIGAFPSQKLQVNGNGVFSGTVTASCGILACSDIRYKKNISPLTNSLTSILAMQGIYYDWDDAKFADKSFNDKRQIGFSAQELEKLYPEIVHTDIEGYKSVDYSRLTPVLVEAMKEQQKIIDQQNGKLESQQEQIDFLKKEIAELKEKTDSFISREP